MLDIAHAVVFHTLELASRGLYIGHFRRLAPGRLHIFKRVTEALTSLRRVVPIVTHA